MKIAVTLLTCCLLLRCAVSQFSVRQSFIRFDKVYGHLNEIKTFLARFDGKMVSEEGTDLTRWNKAVDAIKLKMDQSGQKHAKIYEDIRTALGKKVGEMESFATIFASAWNAPFYDANYDLPFAQSFVWGQTYSELFKYSGYEKEHQNKRIFLRCASQYLISKKQLLKEAERIQSSFAIEMEKFYKTISPVNWAVWQQAVATELATSKLPRSKLTGILKVVPFNEGFTHIAALQNKLEAALKQAAEKSGADSGTSGPLGTELLKKF